MLDNSGETVIVGNLDLIRVSYPLPRKFDKMSSRSRPIFELLSSRERLFGELLPPPLSYHKIETPSKQLLILRKTFLFQVRPVTLERVSRESYSDIGHWNPGWKPWLGKMISIPVFRICVLFSLVSSAVLDCLVLPVQNKLEDWKKITHALDKEHSKGV